MAAGQIDTDSTPGDGAGDDFASVDVIPGTPVDLSLAKTVDNPSPGVGTTVVFTLTLENAAGMGDATAVAVKDALPAGYAYLSDDAASTGTSYAPITGIWSAGDLAAGNSKTLRISARIRPSGPYVNAAEVTGAGEADIDSTPGDGTGDDYATATTTPTSTIDLSVGKSVDQSAPAVGASVLFTVTVANAPGFSDATAVAVRDALPPGYTYLSHTAAPGTGYDPVSGVWTVGALSSGAGKTLEISARVNATGSYVNEAEVTGAGQIDIDSTPDDRTGDDHATASTTPGAVIDLSLTKTVDRPASPVGGTVVFTLVVSNAAGRSDATGVVVGDVLPSGYAYLADDAAASLSTYDRITGAWSVGALAAGASATLRITAGVLPQGSYANEAEVRAAGQPDADSTPGDRTGDDFATAATTPTPTIDLSLTKTVDDPLPEVGSRIQFTLTVSNAAGWSDASGVVVTDALPAGYAYVADDSASSSTTYDPTGGTWNVGSVPSGSSKTLHITARVGPSGPYRNTAEVRESEQTDTDSRPGDGAGDDYASVDVGPTAVIDLSVTKDVSDVAPPVGGTIVFPVKVTAEAGFSDATGVVAVDLLPSGLEYVSDDAASTETSYDPGTGSWTIGDLAAGSSKVLRIVVRVRPSGSYRNTVEVVAASEYDRDSTPGDGTGDDFASVTVAPVPTVDLSLGKSVSDPAPRAGDTVEFTLTVSNEAGRSDATGVVVTDRLPSGYAWRSDDSAATGTSYAPDTGDWTVGTVAGGSSRSLRIVARVLSSGAYVNTAEVSASAPRDADSTPGNGVGRGEDDEATRVVAPLGSDARIDITDTGYPGDTLKLAVEDDDLDADPLDAETITLPVVDDATGESQTVTLTETGPATGIFLGTVPTAFRDGVPADNGKLDTRAGDTVTSRYLDALTSTGVPATRTDTCRILGGTDGAIEITSSFAPGESITVTVRDADLDLDPNSPDAATVMIRNDRTGETESVTLAETGPATGVFTATVSTEYGAEAGDDDDGSFRVGLGDTLTASYSDARTAAGGTAVVTATGRVTVEGIRLTKSASKDQVTIGDVVLYTLTAENALSIPMPGVTIEDSLPGGFKLVPDSARLTRAGPDGILGTADDVSAPAAVTGIRPVSIAIDFGARETIVVRYLLRVGAGAAEGEHANRATPFLTLGGTPTVAGNTATATVALVADPVFDQGTVLGKVYEDRDGNDAQDEGEPGVAGAMVVLDDGTYARTDESGRYHFPAVLPGYRMVKINLDSLPPGSQRDVRGQPDRPDDSRAPGARGLRRDPRGGGAVHRATGRSRRPRGGRSRARAAERPRLRRRALPQRERRAGASARKRGPPESRCAGRCRAPDRKRSRGALGVRGLREPPRRGPSVQPDHSRRDGQADSSHRGGRAASGAALLGRPLVSGRDGVGGNGLPVPDRPGLPRRLELHQRASGVRREPQDHPVAGADGRRVQLGASRSERHGRGRHYRRRRRCCSAIRARTSSSKGTPTRWARGKRTSICPAEGPSPLGTSSWARWGSIPRG